MSEFNFNVRIFGESSANLKAAYISWVPAPMSLENTGDQPVNVDISYEQVGNSITQLDFMEEYGVDPSPTMTITVNPGETKEFFVAGKFQPGKPHNGASPDGMDVFVVMNMSHGWKAKVAVMVRVRRNANELSAKAKRDFINALATVNGIKVGNNSTAPGAGKGIYSTDFVPIHQSDASANEHGDTQFLPWHRLYLLDLERQLQNVNPAVTLPYWRFDQVAPNVFSKDFMGETSTTSSNVAFNPSNNLSKWKIGSVSNISRSSSFNTLTDAPPHLRTQAQTLALGGATGIMGTHQSQFSKMEGNPHGWAHGSFSGSISSISTAPRDPLFFLLHCNVDRLWAMWQFMYKRDKFDDKNTYPYQTSEDTSNAWKLVNAQQWPWSGGKTANGQLDAPGTRSNNFTKTLTGKNFTGNVPTIKDTIDIYAYHDRSNYLGFCYDDVPFDYTHKKNITA